jgi:hypothetical protein
MDVTLIGKVRLIDLIANVHKILIQGLSKISLRRPHKKSQWGKKLIWI